MTLPRITLVTPSFNQGRYLEATLRSVLDQGYPNLEYIVMDGGSTDDSRAIIERYQERLAYWISQPDDGQYAAIASGFARSTGEVMGWLNSDDLHTPWTLHTVGQIFADLPEVEWISTTYPMYVDGDGRMMAMALIDGFHRDGFLRGEYMTSADWLTRGWIMQEGTFWRRSLWERAGGLNTRSQLAADFGLWAQFFAHAPLYALPLPLACFRAHADQKTSTRYAAYVQEALGVLRANGGQPRSRALSAFIRNYSRFIPPRIAVKLKLRFVYRTISYSAAARKWQTGLTLSRI